MPCCWAYAPADDRDATAATAASLRRRTGQISELTAIPAAPSMPICMGACPSANVPQRLTAGPSLIILRRNFRSFLRNCLTVSEEPHGRGGGVAVRKVSVLGRAGGLRQRRCVRSRRRVRTPIGRAGRAVAFIDIDVARGELLQRELGG